MDWGSWEAMKMDPNSGFPDKILLDGRDANPLPKHDYLLKVMAKLYKPSSLAIQAAT
jgi:hypothetical protein